MLHKNRYANGIKEHVEESKPCKDSKFVFFLIDENAELKKELVVKDEEIKLLQDEIAKLQTENNYLKTEDGKLLPSLFNIQYKDTNDK